MGIFGRIDTFITWFDGVVWGLPLIILILVTGIFLTVRLGLLQVRYLGKALKFMVKNEEDGHGEVTSFGALCTALSATIGTGNIVGVHVLDLLKLIIVGRGGVSVRLESVVIAIWQREIYPFVPCIRNHIHQHFLLPIIMG